MFRKLVRRRAIAYAATGLGLSIVVLVATVMNDAGAGTTAAARAVATQHLGQTAEGIAALNPYQRSRLVPLFAGKAVDAKASSRQGAAEQSVFGSSTMALRLAAVAEEGAAQRSGTTTTTRVPDTTSPAPQPKRKRHTVPTKTVTFCAHPYAGTSLTGFIAAAQVSYPATECLSAWGESLTVAATAQIEAPAALDFEAAKLTGTSSLGGTMLDVGLHAARTSITQVTLAQGSGSSNGITCSVTCTITASTIEGMRGNGIFVSGAGSDGSVIGGSSPATRVSTVGTLLSGIMFNHDAGVTVGYVTSAYDNHNGVLFNSVSAPCSATSISVSDLGQPTTTWGLSKNDSGGGLNLIGTGMGGGGCSFNSVTDSGNGGYGVDLTNASHNAFGYVSVTGEATGQLNSGINLSTGSAGNSFTTARVTHEATAVDIGGNGVSGGRGEAGNDGNLFRTLYVSGDSYGSVSITGGEDNTFTTIIGTNEGDAVTGTFYEGLIQFQYQAQYLSCNGGACPVSGNTVTSATFSGGSGRWWDTARYVVYSDAGTTDNSVRLASMSRASYSKAPCSAEAANHFEGC